MNPQLQKYREVNVNTMSRGKIVVLLYSGAITALNRAKVYMEKKDYFNKGRSISKSLDIINELNLSLDMEKGMEISANLRKLYLFLNRYLIDASIKNDPVMVDKAIKILNTLRSAFEEITTKAEYQEAQDINRRRQEMHAVQRLV